MSPPTAAEALRGRLEAFGREIGGREAAHREALDAARRQAERLRKLVSEGLDAFHDAVENCGAPHLRVNLGETRVDDKHLRSIEFDLSRGRHRAIVTVKSRGEVTLVGPFQAGKQEGPCRSFPLSAESEIHKALGDFLERFLTEAATP